MHICIFCILCSLRNYDNTYYPLARSNACVVSEAFRLSLSLAFLAVPPVRSLLMLSNACQHQVLPAYHSIALYSCKLHSLHLANSSLWWNSCIPDKGRARAICFLFLVLEGPCPSSESKIGGSSSSKSTTSAKRYN